MKRARAGLLYESIAAQDPSILRRIQTYATCGHRTDAWICNAVVEM
jgi:hypothetical protein